MEPFVLWLRQLPLIDKVFFDGAWWATEAGAAWAGVIATSVLSALAAALLYYQLLLQSRNDQAQITTPLMTKLDEVTRNWYEYVLTVRETALQYKLGGMDEQAAHQRSITENISTKKQVTRDLFLTVDHVCRLIEMRIITQQSFIRRFDGSMIKYEQYYDNHNEPSSKDLLYVHFAMRCKLLSTNQATD